MLRNLCLLGLFCGAWPAYAEMDILIVGPTSVQTIVGDVNAGKSKSLLCQGCHGEEGISANPLYPNLAGQYQQYLEKQIRDLQRGRLLDPTMTEIASSHISKEDAKDIAAYFASRKRLAGTRSGNKEVIAKGEAIFKEGNPTTGLYACANCHGESGRGKAVNNFVFPLIAGQSKAYLIKQLKLLHLGDRHNDPAGMMEDIAKKLSDEEVDALAEYVSGL